MAKFFITNKKEWYDDLKERILSSDFSLSFDSIDSNIFALATHKLKVQNDNAFKDKRGNFVIAVGTAIYNESLDYSLLLSDYMREGASGGGAQSVRNKTIGQYAYVIYKNGCVEIFTDRMAIFNVYYFNKDNSFLVTNSLYDMASVIRDQISLNEMNFIELVSSCNIFGDETIFNDIKRLAGEKYIHIENGILGVGDIMNISKWNIIEDETPDDLAKQLAGKLAYKAKVVARVLGTPTISMTGGLDSRLLLASYLSAGVKPKMVYGRSNTYIASPIKADEEVLQKLMERYELSLEIKEWDTRYPEQNWKKYLNRYGFLYVYWGACKDIMDSYEKSDTIAYTFGFGGEGYRNSFPLPSNDSSFTLNQIIDAYGEYEYWQNFKNYKIEEYYSHIRKKILGVVKKYALNESNITKDELYCFENEFIKIGHSFAPNLINQIMYCPSLLLESDCLQLSCIPYEQRDGARIMLMTLAHLMPDILDVDFCSRCAIQKVNKETMTLKKVHQRDEKRSRIELFFKSVYNHLGWKKILLPIRNIYTSIEHRKRPIQDNTYEISKKDEQIKYFGKNKIEFLDPRMLLDYKMYSLCLEKLNFQYTYSDNK